MTCPVTEKLMFQELGRFLADLGRERKRTIKALLA